MAKNKLDEMRSRLSITELDQQSRKELLGKFRHAGGKIVNLDEDVELLQKSRQGKTTDTGSYRPRKPHGVTAAGLEVNPFNMKGDSSSVIEQKKDNSVKKNRKESALSVWLTKISCVFGNIFNFSATKFSKKFINFNTGTVVPNIFILKSYLAAIFQNTTPQILEFREYLIKNHLIDDFEMAYHAFNMFDPKLLTDLNQQINTSVDRSEQSFCTFFREMVYFYKSYQLILSSTLTIIKQYELFFSKKIHTNYSQKTLEKIFSTVWQEWYIYLEELVCYYWKRFNQKNNALALVDFLNIGQEPILEMGTMARKWQQEYQQKQKQDEKQQLQESATIFPNKETENGVNFILKNIDFFKYIDIFKETKDLRMLLAPSDQLYYAYVISDFFDKEFASIWNEINFYTISVANTGRFDPKKEVKVLLSKFTQFDELVNDYLRVVRIAKSLVNKDVYKTKEKEISRSSFAARQALWSITSSFAGLLARILSAKKSEQEMIGNWSDVLLTTNKNAEHRLLVNHTVEQAITLAYEFMSALTWLLKYSDLSGLTGNTEDMKLLPIIVINQ